MHLFARALWSALAIIVGALIVPFAFGQEPKLALQTGHSSQVLDLTFSRDGRYMASTSAEGVVIVWDVKAKREVRRWQTFAPGGIGYCHLAFTGRQSLIVTVIGEIMEYPIFSTDTPKVLVGGKDGGGGGGQIAVSDDDHWLAFSNGLGTLRIADLTGVGKFYTVVEGISPFASPAAPPAPPKPPSQFLFSHDSAVLAVVTITGVAYFYKVGPSPSLQSQADVPLAVMDFAFDRNGHLLVCGHKQLTPKEEDVRSLGLEVFDLTAGVSVFNSPFLVGRARFSSAGNALVVGGAYRARIVDHEIKARWTIRVLDAHSGKDLMPRQHNIFPDDMLGIAITPEASKLSFSHGVSHVSLWDVKSGGGDDLGGPIRQVERVEVFNGLTQLAAMTTTEAYVWDLITGRQVKEIPISGGYFAFSKKSPVAAYFDKAHRLRFLDFRSGSVEATTIQAKGEVREVKLFPNGTSVAWVESTTKGDEETLNLQLWDKNRGGTPRTLCYPEGGLAISEAGRYLAAKCSFSKPPIMAPPKDPKDLNEAWTRNRAGTEWHDKNYKTRVFDLKTSTSKDTGLYESGTMTFSIDDRFLAAAGQIVQVADLQDNTTFDLRESKKTSHWYTALAFSSHGTLIAGMQDQSSLEEWNLNDRTFKLIEVHQNGTTSLAFGDDGKLFTGGRDGSTGLVDAKMNALRVSMISVGSYGWLAVTPDGLFDGTADAMQWVGWKSADAADVYPLDMFFNDFYYPGLLTDIVAGASPKPEGDTIASRLRIPGLKYLLASREAFLTRRNGQVGLCLPDQPTSELLQQFKIWEKGTEQASTAGFKKTSDVACRFFKALPGNLQQYELTASRLSGETTIKKKTEWDDLPPRLGNGRIHVQTVAINNYPEKSGLRTLSYALDDAGAIEAFFAPNADGGDHYQCYGSTCMWKRITEQAATLKQIRGRFQEIANESNEEDIVVIFLSGHGVVPPGQEMFYFLPFDVAGKSPAQQIASGLNSAMLAEAIMELRARRVLLIIDSCQSGGAMDSLERVVEAKLRIEHRRESALKGSDNVGAGLYVIAASTPLQNAMEVKELMHGVLTRAILESLAAQEAPTARSLAEAVPRKTKTITSILPKKQTPVVVQMGVDFPLTAPK